MYDGTITSKLKPIVTMLTEALVKDFAPAYTHVGPAMFNHPLLFERTDEAGTTQIVTAEVLEKDVREWLMGLEQEMDNESDRQFAKMTTQMIRKNPGWVKLLTNRLIKRLTGESSTVG